MTAPVDQDLGGLLRCDDPPTAVLRNPHWPWAAASALGDEVPWPPQQYTRAQRRRVTGSDQ